MDLFLVYLLTLAVYFKAWLALDCVGVFCLTASVCGIKAKKIKKPVKKSKLIKAS